MNPWPPAFTTTVASADGSATTVSAESSSTFDSTPSIDSWMGTTNTVGSSVSVKENRCWLNTSDEPSSRAVINGYPGCQIHESISARTGTDGLTFSMASHKSPVSVLPYACVLR